jgi:DNA-3-methyladenine glycosylase
LRLLGLGFYASAAFPSLTAERNRLETVDFAMPELRLARAFYQQSVLTVARQLLGKGLVHRTNGAVRVGRIVETEAYLGRRDLASHASKGLTPRTEVLFGPAGHAYVYFIYGMHCCFNVVGGPEGIGGAILVRAVEPLEGVVEAARTDGPGRLCRALGITLEHNREDLLGKRLFIADLNSAPSLRIERGPRVGVDYSGIWAKKPYRFWIRGNAFVSSK